MTETISILDALKGFDFRNLNPVQREVLQRDIVRFVLDLMRTDKHNRLQYLEILWKIPNDAYQVRDKERLNRFEPLISNIFNVAKFPRHKCSALPLANEVRKYYRVHDGDLDPLFLDIFKSSWDYDFQELKKLFFSQEQSLSDLGFLFVMSIDKEKLDGGFYKRLSESGYLYPGLVGKAVLIEKFKEPDEELSNKELKAYCEAQTFHNKSRPIVKYYRGLVKRFTPEQLNSFMVSKILPVKNQMVTC